MSVNVSKISRHGNEKLIISQYKISTDFRQLSTELLENRILNYCLFCFSTTGVCNGWDNTHYQTFDGIQYTVNETCDTYVLVKEIMNTHGNLSVLIDNYFCDASDAESCSRAIIVNYKFMEIVLSSQVHEEVRTNKVM